MNVEPLLKTLIAELKDVETLGIFLTGSLARGEENTHSDIDLKVLCASEPRESHRYEYRNNVLISITYMTQEKIMLEFSRPEHAIWAVPGFRQAKILYDPHEILAHFKHLALEFDFSNLQAQANVWASQQLQAWAEEVHKMMGGLELHDLERMIAPVWGIAEGMTRIVAVAQGIMIDSENRYFKLVREHLVPETRWVELQQIALGLKTVSLELRAWAALDLYTQTAILLESVIQNQDRAVIAATLEKIVHFNIHFKSGS